MFHCLSFVALFSFSSASLFCVGSMHVICETCDLFQLLCHLGSYILSSSLRVDPVCAAFFCVQTMLWLPKLTIFNMCTDINGRDFTL